MHFWAFVLKISHGSTNVQMSCHKGVPLIVIERIWTLYVSTSRTNQQQVPITLNSNHLDMRETVAMTVIMFKSAIQKRKDFCSVHFPVKDYSLSRIINSEKQIDSSKHTNWNPESA